MNLLNLFEDDNSKPGNNYAEELAHQIFKVAPELDATGAADEVLDYAFDLAVNDLGRKRAHSLFAYDEDFDSDLVSAYADLQRQEVNEGYYDLTQSNVPGMEPIDFSTNPSFKDIIERYTQLVYQGHAGETSPEEDEEYDAIEQYVAKRFGEKGSAHLQKAGEVSYWGRDDKPFGRDSRSSNLGRPNQPSGDFRTTKAGKMHGQDAKMMKAKVADRLGRHPAPNLPESLADEFMAMAKAKGMNPRLRGTPDEERARTDAMLKQRAADRDAQPAPAGPDAEERAKLEARLKDLEATFDPNFEYSDDHSFWTAQNSISKQINAIKQRLAQGVAEGISIVDQDSDLDQQVYTLNVDGKKVSFTYWDYENNFQSPDIKDIYKQAREQLGKKLSPEQIKHVARAVFKSFEQGVAEDLSRRGFLRGLGAAALAGAGGSAAAGGYTPGKPNDWKYNMGVKRPGSDEPAADSAAAPMQSPAPASGSLNAQSDASRAAAERAQAAAAKIKYTNPKFKEEYDRIENTYNQIKSIVYNNKRQYSADPDLAKRQHAESVKTLIAADKEFAEKTNALINQYGRLKEQGVAEGGFDNASPMTKDSVKADRIRSLKNLITIAKEKGRQLRVQELELELKKLQGVAEEQLDEINWKKAAATGAMALGALGAAGSSQARVTIGPDVQMSPSFAQQMHQQGSQSSVGHSGGQIQNIDTAEKVERNDSGVVVHYDDKQYKGVLVAKDAPTPRGAKKIKITQAQMGERGIGNYTTYLLPNGTAYIYKLDSQIANEGVAEGEGRFAGDTPVNVGGAVVNKIQAGDTVKYFGEKARVIELNRSNNIARISANGKTMNVRLSDLKQLGQGMAEADKKKEDDIEPQVKDVALQRAISRAKADFPAAGSGIEALAKDFMRSQDQDSKSFDQLRQAERKQDQMLGQISKIDQEQEQEIQNLEDQNSTLASRLKQLQNVNNELEKKLAAMSGRRAEKKSTAKDAPVSAPAPVPAPTKAAEPTVTAKKKTTKAEPTTSKAIGQIAKTLAPTPSSAAIDQIAQQLQPRQKELGFDEPVTIKPKKFDTSKASDAKYRDLTSRIAKDIVSRPDATRVFNPDAVRGAAGQQEMPLENKDKPTKADRPEVDYDDPAWDAMVKRVGQMAKQGPRKTVWDPDKRVYKTVPVNK